MATINNMTDAVRCRGPQLFCLDCRLWRPGFCAITCRTKLGNTPMRAYGRMIRKEHQ